jgi:hypothetical protein
MKWLVGCVGGSQTDEDESSEEEGGDENNNENENTNADSSKKVSIIATPFQSLPQFSVMTCLLFLPL